MVAKIIPRLIFMFLLTDLMVSPVHSLQTAVPNIDLDKIAVFHRSPFAILDIKYSPDGQYLARVYASGQLEILETATDKIILSSTVDLPYPLATALIDWSPEGNQLAAGIGSKIYIWDVKKAQLLETVKTGDSERLINLWDGIPSPNGFTSLQWDMAGKNLMAINLEYRYIVWSPEEHFFRYDLLRGSSAPLEMVWTGDTYVFYSGNGILDLFDNIFWDFPQRMSMKEGSADCSVHSAQSLMRSNFKRTLIAWGTYNGCVIILDPLSGNHLAVYKMTNDGAEILNIAWSPDDSMIAAVDQTGEVQVIDLATGKIALIDQIEGTLYAVDWSATDTELAYGGITSWDDTAFGIINMEQIKALIEGPAAYQAEFAIPLSQNTQ